MKKIKNFVLEILAIIIMFIFSPILVFVMFNHSDTVNALLNIDRYSYNGKIKIYRTPDNVLFEGNIIGPFDLPKPIRKMRIHIMDVENDTLCIKVYRNDRLLKKLKWLQLKEQEAATNGK